MRARRIRPWGALLARKVQLDWITRVSVSLLGTHVRTGPSLGAIDISARAYAAGMISYYRTPARTLDRLSPPDAVIVAPSSRTVWLSGAWGWDEDEVLRVSDSGGQTRLALRNLELILVELGGSLADLVKTVIYVVSHDDDTNWDHAWEAYVEVLGENQPATTIVGVTRLGRSETVEALVEIEATAVLPA